MTEGPARPLAQFERIAQVIRERVQADTYPVGSQLPSIGALAAEFETSHMTVKQALAALSHEGLVVSRRGVRAEIVAAPRSDPHLSIAERLAQVESAVSSLQERFTAVEDHVSNSTRECRS